MNYVQDAKGAVWEALFPRVSALVGNERKRSRALGGRERGTGGVSHLETMLSMVSEVHYRIQNKKQPD